ncbi:TPA: hypothetical protein ACIPUI_000379 [Citrobacter freundii]
MMFYNGDTGSPEVIKDKNVFLVKKTMVAYWNDYPCHCGKFFVLDLSGNTPVISNELSDLTASAIDWISWGDKNSVISLGGLKYKYENGKVIFLEDNN